MKLLYITALFGLATQLYSCEQCASCSKKNVKEEKTDKESFCEKDFADKQTFRLFLGKKNQDGWACIIGP